jgi:tetratricopeptide (TPR) repeat protein
MKELAEAIRLNPSFAHAHYGLGKALAQLNKLDWAVSEYKEALRIDPGLGIAYFDLGLALEEAGRLGEAAEAYGSFIRNWRMEHGALCEFADRRLNDLEKSMAVVKVK